MRRFLRLLLMLACCSAALAEIPCQCEQEHCRCFIQFGDMGPAVAAIQQALISQDCLIPEQDSSVFDRRTYDAVLLFQQRNNLSPTGMLDDETLTLLLWGILPEVLDKQQPLTSKIVVWIPTDGGIRHHDKFDCSGMYDPRLVTQRNALAMEMLHCGRCKPSGYVKPTK